MKSLFPRVVTNTSLLLLAMLANSVCLHAQEDEVQDEVSQQASQFEAELGKYRDTSPEAGNLLVQLADLYFNNGRALGLVRVAQTFTTAHVSDPRHEQMMLRLIDGQQVLSRNKDLIATCRQYLTRYATSGNARNVEVLLSEVLNDGQNVLDAADAAMAVWVRHGNSLIGKEYAERAVRLYLTLGGESRLTAAELAEDVLNKIPNGTYASAMGRNANATFAALSKWAESNRVIDTLLKRGLVPDRVDQQVLHVQRATNYRSLEQYTNAANAYQQARSIKDDADLFYAQCQSIIASKSNAQQSETIVNQFYGRFPNDLRKGSLRISVASQYDTEGNEAKALSLWRAVLIDDAYTSGAANTFASRNGVEPAKLADTERVLRDAINKNERHRSYLYYVLAQRVHLTGQMNPARAHQVAMEGLMRLENDEVNYASALASLALSATTDDNAARNSARQLLDRQRRYMQINYAGGVNSYISSIKANKELKPRHDALRNEYQAYAGQAIVKNWQLLGTNNANGGRTRAAMLASPEFNQMSVEMKRRLLYAHAYYLQYQAPTAQRSGAASEWAKLVQMFPKEVSYARVYLNAATDYAPEEIQKAAANHMLTQQLDLTDGDAFRRMMLAAERNKDKALAQRVLSWYQQLEQKFGYANNYGVTGADPLIALEMTDQAMAHWRRYLPIGNTETRDALSRINANSEAEAPARIAMYRQAMNGPGNVNYAGYAQATASILLAQEQPDFNQIGALLKEIRTRRDELPFTTFDIDDHTVMSWVGVIRANEEVTDQVKLAFYDSVLNLRLFNSAAYADIVKLKLASSANVAPMERLKRLQGATLRSQNEYRGWDALKSFVDLAIAEQDHIFVTTVGTGLLTNITSVDQGRRDAMRTIVSRSYTQSGGVGLTIDEDSPVAPLLQSALYLRLGDRQLAYDLYEDNKSLFDEHRDEVPVDLILFVSESLVAAGGDDNHDYVEDVLRTWVVRNAESAQITQENKAKVQLLLAKNYFTARRFDLARSEYTTVTNLYPETEEATEAQFGIGESFMEQKVFDQAEQVFEELTRSSEALTIIRAEFLQGVLMFRRGDRNEARDVFRSVLERVPDVELANQTLYNLAEIYRVEERYIDQLNLLRTVGRLGHISKRFHAPGLALSIVVHDSDLGISRGHNRIPVVVTTIPGGDVEEIFLTSTGAGKGLFRADLDTALGDVTEGDGILQLMGDDVVKCDYPEEFKQEFKNVPLSDVEIQVAANADFAVQSSVIETEEEATFSQQLEQESDDQRVSQIRPATQVKPGNPLYIRIEDADRDTTSGQDEVVVKLATDSGDEVQVVVTETEPHSGIFEGQVPTAELPAGATASDSAIDHSPLMAIDQSKDTVWVSRPDGQTPKILTVDMKDLYSVSRVRVASPSEEDQAPVRMDIQGSYDGEYWFRVATYPSQAALKGVADEYVGINRRVYAGDYRSYRDWNQVLNLVGTGTPIEDEPGFEEFGDLDWSKEAIEEEEKVIDPAHAVVWHGLLIAERSGAVRLRVEGETTALLVDGVMELSLNAGARNVDVWLEKGQHEITVFAACSKGSSGVRVKRAYASVNTQQVSLQPFTEEEWAAEREEVLVEETPFTGRQDVDLSAARFIKTTAEFGFKETEMVKVVGNWTSLEDQFAVSLGAIRPGLYELWLEYAHPGTSGRFSVQLGRQEIEHPVIDSGGWGVYVPDRAGIILVEDGGSRDLLIKPLEIQGGGLMELRNIFLVPAKQGIVDLNNEWEFRFPSYDLRYTRIIVNEYIGNSVAINHVVVGDANEKETQIPTDADILSLAQNNILEIAAGDIVRATYTDERTQNQGGTGRLLTSELQATYYNASISPIAYDQQRSGAGGVTFTPKALMRIDPGERITIQVTDYDRDQSDELDEIVVEVSVNDDAPIVLTATETDEYSGIFTKEVDTAGEQMEDRLVVKQGDRVYIRYLDEQNTFPGHSVKRESVVYVNEPTDAQVRIVSSRMIPRPEGQTGLPTPVYLPVDEDDVSAVAFEVPLLVEVIDPDMAKDDRSQVTVAVQASNGSTLLVDCIVSSQFSDLPANAERDEALYQGRFIGQIIMQLGSKDSPALVPLTIGMPRGLVGRTRLPDEEEDGDLGGLVARVLNLSGEDQVLLAYKDEIRATGEPSLLKANARIVSNGQLNVTDREYEDVVEQLHVGEKLYLRVYDADKDISDERDEVVVEITTELGEKEVVKLFETTIHSGEFTGSYQLVAAEKPTPSNSEDTDPKIESYFGDVISVSYIDDAAATETGELSVLHEIPVVVGTNGLVSAFTKVFNDEELAVETKFRIAESYFELFKSHKELGRDEDLGRDLEAGRRILKEVMEDYPDPKYVPRIAYLRGQFAQELEQWSEAIRSYELLLTQYPDHTLAADAQYKLAQTYEDAGDFDEALEAYVTLAATYPNSPLIASVMIRIADHFYKQENFKVAAQVGEKFLEKFSSHEYASRMAFRVGQCYYKNELYTEAGASFDRFAKLFPEDPLGSDSMFWAGESYRMGNNNQLAFRRYNRCRWDFPSSEAAKYARGRLALPEMIQQFETEANSIDNDN